MRLDDLKRESRNHVRHAPLLKVSDFLCLCVLTNDDSVLPRNSCTQDFFDVSSGDDQSGIVELVRALLVLDPHRRWELLFLKNK